MKTAISVPDETFDRAERVAHAHGMSRSQFYARAAERYAAELEADDLTAAIDAAIDATGTDGSTTWATFVGRALLEADDEQW